MADNRKRIILVDDNITNLTLGRSVLSGNYDVMTVPSGEKLFMLLTKITPDLILLDIEMPQMNGFEVFDRLKSNEETANIPVIFLSAKEDSETRQKAVRLGAADFVSKPFLPELLLKCIETGLCN